MPLAPAGQSIQLLIYVISADEDFVIVRRKTTNPNLGKGVTSGVVVTGDDVYDTWEQFIWLVYIGWVYLLKLKKELKLFLSVRPSTALAGFFLSKYLVSCLQTEMGCCP